MAVETVKRESFWDVLKGMSILSVIVMHWANYDTASPIVYSIRKLAQTGTFLFVFMSGWFSSRANPTATWVARRAWRLLMPYLFWTLAFVAMFAPGDFLDAKRLVIDDFLLGGGVNIGYYVIVIFQLTLLTPLLTKAIVRSPALTVFAAGVCNAFGLLIVYLAYFGKIPLLGLKVPVPYPAVFCFVWIFPYVVGLACRTYENGIRTFMSKHHAALAISLTVLAAFLVCEGRFWRERCPGLECSQFTFSSFAFSATIALAAVCVFNRVKVHCDFLECLGRCSFFVYLTHTVLAVRPVSRVVANFAQMNVGELAPFVLGIAIIACGYYGVAKIATLRGGGVFAFICRLTGIA